jgi:hypothetical protein
MQERFGGETAPSAEHGRAALAAAPARRGRALEGRPASRPWARSCCKSSPQPQRSSGRGLQRPGVADGLPFYHRPLLPKTSRGRPDGAPPPPRPRIVDTELEQRHPIRKAIEQGGPSAAGDQMPPPRLRQSGRQTAGEAGALARPRRRSDPPTGPGSFPHSVGEPSSASHLTQAALLQGFPPPGARGVEKAETRRGRSGD